jgi:hypothetical protein
LHNNVINFNLNSYIILVHDFQTAPYILSKPLHGSQKVKSKDAKGLVIGIEVIPNYELESWILAFGEKVDQSKKLGGFSHRQSRRDVRIIEKRAVCAGGTPKGVT